MENERGEEHPEPVQHYQLAGQRSNPGNHPEVWSLREGEMTPQESRIQGHLLYAGMFNSIPQTVYAALHEEHIEKKDPEPFNVSAVSAEQYVGKYAQIYGLNTDVLKRWAHQASIELANATIPVLAEERERLARGQWWSQVQKVEYTQDIIEPLLEVAQQGILSPIEYHFHLVGEAYYMGHDLGESVPLNSSLVRGIFDNRVSHI
jgi:hypothetical protein